MEAFEKNSIYPVGFIDSGIGGLSVLRELKGLLSSGCYLYLADSARAPYGTRSQNDLFQALIEGAFFLKGRGARSIVVACNSLSIFSFDSLEKSLRIPVIGAVVPSVKRAAAKAKSKVLVMGTEATINSAIYQRKILELRPDLEVIGAPCGKLVDLVESGRWDGKDAVSEVAKTLQRYICDDIDTVVLGCTHFSFLSEMVYEIFEGTASVLDSSKEVAKALLDMLNGSVMKKSSGSIFVTGDKNVFLKKARRVLSNENFAISDSKHLLGEVPLENRIQPVLLAAP
ncbi:MAG: glutamate racemase [Candidatus Dadabacteria bacterium]|nr:MAG: glutamate racemase [Candidatus Dadabacteria bacterium]